MGRAGTTVADVAGGQVFARDGEVVEGEGCCGFLAVTARGGVLGTWAGWLRLAYGGAGVM
ncbi:hypothetical protein AB0M50_40425 [Nonomuraea fuscirosea]|uniref:hypothetical protein n=1 Tax=Nonomuraea fuscirosea TaxID=1291556 RepID=UPI003432F32F